MVWVWVSVSVSIHPHPFGSLPLLRLRYPLFTFDLSVYFIPFLRVFFIFSLFSVEAFSTNNGLRFAFAYSYFYFSFGFLIFVRRGGSIPCYTVCE